VSNPKKQWIDKKGRTWEWEETAELRAFIAQQSARKSTVTLPLTNAQ
jgi:hypothetical protein